MWNFASLARWEYAVPWVQRFHLFEMPALGYAGYLPFGLECVAVAALFWIDDASSLDASWNSFCTMSSTV